MDEIKELRNYVREILLKIRKEQKNNLRTELKEEKALRKLIRKMLYEVKETSPHESTGINLLAKLLDNIIPVVETGYKNLTTDAEQRKSFRSHIMKATQNLLSTASVYFVNDDSKQKESEQTKQPDEQLKEIDEDPKKKMFIDIKKDEKNKEKAAAQNPENAFQPIEGEDTTGRSFALETFKKIQKQTLESYSLLSNPEDRKTFYKYLITNLGLYFDQFEDELKTMVPEPTTPEYEAEKKKKEAELQASVEAEPSTGSETSVEELPSEVSGV
jgi:hypothetical protein